MVIPLLIGCAVNTFVPQCLEIGGFTTALFKSGQSTLVGLFIFCSGATINVKQVGKPLYKGAVLTILKLVIDPHISPASAEVQIPRIVEASGLSEDEVRQIIADNTKGKTLGVFGEETVNVLGVNLDIALAMGLVGEISK